MFLLCLPNILYTIIFRSKVCSSRYYLRPFCSSPNVLSHWGRVTHKCVSKLTIIDSDNGLSPGRRQVIIWTNAGILLIATLGTNFSEISSEIRTFSFKKMHLKMSYAKLWPFYWCLHVLTKAAKNVTTSNWQTVSPEGRETYSVLHE